MNYSKNFSLLPHFLSAPRNGMCELEPSANADHWVCVRSGWDLPLYDDYLWVTVVTISQRPLNHRLRSHPGGFEHSLLHQMKAPCSRQARLWTLLEFHLKGFASPPRLRKDSALLEPLIATSAYWQDGFCLTSNPKNISRLSHESWYSWLFYLPLDCCWSLRRIGWCPSFHPCFHMCFSAHFRLCLCCFSCATNQRDSGYSLTAWSFVMQAHR